MQRQWKTRRRDPDIFASHDRIRSRVPEHQFVEAAGFEGKADEGSKTELESVFHRPDGRHTFRQMLAVSVDRYKSIGSAHWLLRRAGDVASDLDGRIDQFAKTLGDNGVPLKAIPLLSDALSKAVGDQLDGRSGSDVVGFEWLQGYVLRDQHDETRFIQVVGGSTPREKFFPERDIVEFIQQDPEHGDPLSSLEAIEAWSDASIWAFMLNRDAARTGGMADLLLAVEGMSEPERKRLMGLMLQRANPSQSDLSWIPIIVRLTSTYQGRPPVIHDVSLSKKDRDAQWGDWDESLDKRKAATTGVPLPLTKEWKMLNRATGEVLERAFKDYTWWPLFCDIAETTNDRLVVDELGIMDWVFEFIEPDFRSSEERFRQEMQQVEAGLTTPYNAVTDLHGVQEADRILADLNGRGLDGDVWKLPWHKTGKGWVPITTVLRGASGDQGGGEFDPLASAVEGAMSEGEEPGVDEDADGDNGQASGGAGPAAPDLEKSLRVLDDWQKACGEAVRAGADPQTAWPDQWTVDDVDAGAMADVDERLAGAETPQAVSDAFAPARRELRNKGGDAL
jgi:hypothetical protein